MKILCVSDQIDPLVYSNTIKDRFSDVDLILAAGDLPLDYLDFIVSTLNKPLYFVFGNHHAEELCYFDGSARVNYLDACEGEFRGTGAIHLGTRVRVEAGLIIAGLGGSMRYNRGPNQYTEFQMYLEIGKLIPMLLFHRIFHKRYVDILLTHAPPRGIHDKSDKCHWGFKAFLWFIKTFRPRYLVHGHIHLYDLADVRCTKREQTTIINAYSHYIIDTSLQNNAANAKGIENE